VLNPTTASLNGALTTTLINGFVPTVGQTFTILNYTSETGTFASCDGRSGGTTCPINSTEHFNITYNSTDVVLTVASGAAPTFAQFKRWKPTWLGLGLYGKGRIFPHPSSAFDALAQEARRVSAVAAFGAPLVSESLFAPSGASTRTIHSRSFADGVAPVPHSLPAGGDPAYSVGATSARLGSQIALPDRAIFSPVRLQTSPRAYLGQGVMGAWELASMDSGMRQKALSRIAAFSPARDFSTGAVPHRFASVGANGAVESRINPTGALVRNNGRSPGMPVPKMLQYHLDLLSILSASPRQAWRNIMRQPGSPDAGSFGYLTFSSIR
jgi:hypothetical protein